MNVLKRLLLLFVPLLAACNDGLGPQFWSPIPDTMLIHSASRGEYVGLVSAVDLTVEPVTPLPLEAPGLTGNWDFVLAEQNGTMVLMPASAIPGVASRARIAVIEGRSFDSITEAPRDTALFSATPVPVRSDVVYVIRSRRAACGFTSGFRYAKLESVEIDEARGTLRFSVLRNPICDDRALVPPQN